MPRGYDADARRLSRLQQHRIFSRGQDGGISVRGTYRQCRRSILPEPTEIFLAPGVGSLASHLHQVAQVVAVCVELTEGAQLGHDVGGVDAADQHPLHRVAAARSVRCRPFWLLRVVAPALSKLPPVVHEKMYGAGLTAGNAD